MRFGSEGVLTKNEEIMRGEGFCLGFENLLPVEVGGYDSWEESRLVKFSEFLGFSNVGHEIVFYAS